MDIMVTTPKHSIKTAEQEALNSIANGGGRYFRNLGQRMPRDLEVGDRVFFIELNAVRGFCLVDEIESRLGNVCDTTGLRYPAGYYLWMQADSWHWIDPVPMIGFQGWRYRLERIREKDILIVGGWLDPRPTPELILYKSLAKTVSLFDGFDKLTSQERLDRLY